MRRTAILLATLLPWSSAAAATLTVDVEGVRTTRGQIRIGVCRKSEFLSERCAYHAVVPARIGTVSAAITGIIPDVYAVAAYQDEDGAGTLKRNFFGMPEEDLGFSRNPALRFGAPSFARCAITIGNKGGRIALMLRKFGS